MRRPILPDLPHPERNVFLMIRFGSVAAHELLTNTITETLARYGLHLVRADRRNYRDTLWENVRFCMEGCDYGIAVFDAAAGEAVSPSVSLELGYMLAKNRRCLLLKDKHISFPTDLAGHLCQEFDAAAIPQTVPGHVLEWLRDIGVRKQADERLVLLVSNGGTCRDPMAKAITETLLRGRKTGGKIRVQAGARGFPNRDEVSRAARRAIKDMFGHDLLATYRPVRLADALIEDADLILVMNEWMCDDARLPPEKTHVLKRFFGSEGDVADPWPDGDDETAKERYARCAQELRTVIEPNLGRLIDFLERA